MKKVVIFIVGPTAVGKTAVAVKLAKKLNGEIISCDSMQVYKGMDILTSKPPKSLRKEVRHHLFGVVPAAKEYNVSLFRKDALKKIREVIKRNHTPVFCGGTGLYMSILLDGIFKMRKPDAQIRERLYNEAGEFGSQYLHNRLKAVDPEAAAKIHPNDAKRIVRALEVFIATGKRISNLQKTRKGIYDKYNVRIFCLNMPREALYTRINARVEDMFKKGAVRETLKLFKSRFAKTARSAIGINEIKGFLDGAYNLGETKGMIKRNTCLYAKRQLTWFRKDKRIEWVQINPADTAADVAERILKLYGKSVTSDN